MDDDVELMVRVASLYYLEDVIQEDIARALGISRAKVGRLLKKAQKEGIVEITLNVPTPLALSLETELVQRFSLKHALLAPDVQDPDTQRSLVARSVANYLSRNLKDGAVVGVSMGRNVGAVAERVTNATPRSCTFVSIFGGSPQVEHMLNPNDIGRRLAEAFGGESESLYAPAYVESPEVRQAFLRHEEIAHTLERGRRSEVALVGIGDVYGDSHVVKMGLLSASEADHLRLRGAVGVILGCFFDIDGQQITDEMETRTVGLSTADLFRIPNLIAIASEANKVAPILGALRSGLVNTLATSVDNAQRVLALDESSPSKSSRRTMPP